MKRMNFRIDDMELRSCGERLTDIKPHSTAEIVQWQKPKDEKEFCYVLAYWRLIPNSDEYELVFVGSRPFMNDIDRNTFWKLAKMGQELLDEEFREANS